MSFTVLTPNPVPEEAARLLRDHDITIQQIEGDEKKDILRDIREVQALVVFKAANYTIDREIIDAGKNLQLIARFGVGMEIVDVEYARGKGITVTNTPTANSNSVAELAIYHLIALAKNARVVDKRIRSGEFKQIWKLQATELQGQTLGIIGIGHIGQLVAKKARYGLGMRVIGYNPHPNALFIPEIEKVDSLEDLLAQSDAVTLHVPLTEETRSLIDAKAIEKMKKTAVLINTARGPVVDEPALIQALKEGRIAGAGLDVFEQEPINPDSELFAFDNVTLTPHYGGFTRGAVRQTWLDVAESVAAVKEGKTVRFEV